MQNEMLKTHVVRPDLMNVAWTIIDIVWGWHIGTRRPPEIPATTQNKNLRFTPSFIAGASPTKTGSVAYTARSISDVLELSTPNSSRRWKTQKAADVVTVVLDL